MSEVYSILCFLRKSLNSASLSIIDIFMVYVLLSPAFEISISFFSRAVILPSGWVFPGSYPKHSLRLLLISTVSNTENHSNYIQKQPPDQSLCYILQLRIVIFITGKIVINHLFIGTVTGFENVSYSSYPSLSASLRGSDLFEDKNNLVHSSSSGYPIFI